MAAEGTLLEALDLARLQQALAWELRATTTLARLRREQGRIDEAYDLVKAVHGRFSEGHGTEDLSIAKGLLKELSS